MLSRVADNLYWYGRYLRRAENTARLINVNANLVLDLPRNVAPGWAPLIAILGADTAFREHYKDASESEVIRFLTIDERNPASIRSSLSRAREILRVSRDVVPREVWERLNDLYLYVMERGDAGIARAQRGGFLNQVINSALLVHGVMIMSMSRDVGYQFLRIGTTIEQADMTTRILDVRSAPLLNDGSSGSGLTPFGNIQWMAVLSSLTAYQMYRRNVRARVNGPGVLRFLLQNRDFPRAVMFCLSSLADAMPHLPANRKIERSIDRTRSLVRDANIEALLGTGSGLPQLMDEIQIGLGEVHTALSEAYFSA
jgi:uncharacterized alpha-E superfamily protein